MSQNTRIRHFYQSPAVARMYDQGTCKSRGPLQKYASTVHLVPSRYIRKSSRVQNSVRKVKLVTATRYILESEIIYKTTVVSFQKKEVGKGGFFDPVHSCFCYLQHSNAERKKKQHTDQSNCRTLRTQTTQPNTKKLTKAKHRDNWF